MFAAGMMIELHPSVAVGADVVWVGATVGTIVGDADVGADVGTGDDVTVGASVPLHA